jgi:hypothetical protein
MVKFAIGLRPARVVAALAALVAWMPASAALAAPVDVASDHVLIRAYETFLTGVLSDVPSWRNADNGYISGISVSCPNVLAAVNILPANQVNQGAAVALGEEIGGDLLVSQGTSRLHRMARPQASISTLHWSNRKARNTVNGYASAWSAFNSLAPSDLCADATAFAASNAQTTPPGTLQWLATFGALATRNQSASGAFSRPLSAELPSLLSKTCRSATASTGRSRQ